MNAAAPDRLLQLQRRFLDGLERRLDDMSTELDAAADADALMRMFHSLAGIGGTYGFPRVSDQPPVRRNVHHGGGGKTRHAAEGKNFAAPRRRRDPGDHRGIAYVGLKRAVAKTTSPSYDLTYR